MADSGTFQTFVIESLVGIFYGSEQFAYFAKIKNLLFTSVVTFAMRQAVGRAYSNTF
jgi:hypothetical protein